MKEFNQKTKSFSWVQVSVFDKAAEMYSGDCCRMARLLGTKSCEEVYDRLQKASQSVCFHVCLCHCLVTMT